MMRGCPFVSILMLALCTSSEGEFDEARGFGARALGLGSTPMIGFDAEAVASEFALAEDEVPIMLLSVGGGASVEAAPSGGRSAGLRIVEESGLGRAAAGARSATQDLGTK